MNISRLQPLHATEIGDHRFDDKLEDVSKAAREKWVAHAQNFRRFAEAGRLCRALA